MPKKFIKRYIPDHNKIRDHKNLRFLGTLLHDPNILHLNRRSVSGAFGVGLFMAFIPVPFQMVFAAIGAIFFRVNLPISVALVWLTNPITIPPIYYFTYKVGTLILGQPIRDIKFELTGKWLLQELSMIWEPLLLGCFVVGTISAILGYFMVRGFWRLHVIRSLQERRAKRALKAKNSA